MEALSNDKLVKAQDPIWKRLYVNRIYLVVFLIVGAVAIYSYAANLTRNLTAGNGFLLLYWVFIIAVNVVRPFFQERYWRRIGQRRTELLRGEQDTQPFLASYQIRPEEHALETSTRLQLVWNRTIVLTFGVFAGVLVILLAIFGVLLGVQHSPTFDTFLLVTLALVALFLFILVTFYFTAFRYQAQRIELTDEGMRTRYMRQERFIRWDEAKIFASYGAQGIAKTALTTTYELSNEEVVVRWSQQSTIGFFMTAESATKKKQEWNWLVGRVNAYVAAHTELPLLDLSDAQQARWKRSTRKEVQQYQRQHQQPISSAPSVHSPSNVDSATATVKIAQNDPVQRRLSLRGGATPVLISSTVIGLILLLLACYGKFWSPIGTNSNAFYTTGLNLLFLGGLLSSLSGLLMLWIIGTAVKNLKLIQAKREQAVLYPEHFQVAEQPTSSPEQPQPVSIQVGRRKSSFFLLALVENFIIWFVFAIILFPSAQNNIVLTLIVVGVMALLMALFIIAMSNRSSKTLIEVNAEGISTQTGTLESHIHWQDARLFAKYHPRGLFRRHARIWLYELASEQTLVRWQWPRSQRWRMVTDSTMTQEEYDHWLDEMQKYVIARTDLPLMNLDVD